MNPEPQCLVCLSTPPLFTLKCSHTFCQGCIKQYITHLQDSRQLRPQKLCCMGQKCDMQIEDSVIWKVFPGEKGFIYTTIRKKIRQGKDPNVAIFNCQGYIYADRKPLLTNNNNKDSKDSSKQQISNGITQMCKQIKLNTNSNNNKNQQSQVTTSIIDLNNIKNCNNILSINKSVPRKQKHIQCNVCKCLYCLNCLQIKHEGECVRPQNKSQESNTNSSFAQKQGLLACLNPKCGITIGKEQGCFWVKCRCSWEMCYPCRKLWGECPHFDKYPYKKFVPPPDWMVRALNMY